MQGSVLYAVGNRDDLRFCGMVKGDRQLWDPPTVIPRLGSWTSVLQIPHCVPETISSNYFCKYWSKWKDLKFPVYSEHPVELELSTRWFVSVSISKSGCLQIPMCTRAGLVGRGGECNLHLLNVTYICWSWWSSLQMHNNLQFLQWFYRQGLSISSPWPNEPVLSLQMGTLRLREVSDQVTLPAVTESEWGSQGKCYGARWVVQTDGAEVFGSRTRRDPEQRREGGGHGGGAQSKENQLLGAMRQCM